LAQFGEAAKIDAFLRAKNIDRIILLEDFVGSGSQIRPAIMFAASLPSNIPVLVVPLIVCPLGIDAMHAWQLAYSNIHYRTVLDLRPLDFLTATPQADEPGLHVGLRSIALTTFTQLLGGQTLDEAKVYGPFGFDETGGLIVLTTNCPDNTLPLIHYSSATWNSLFPRASRV
jgi:hypothetical protein